MTSVSEWKLRKKFLANKEFLEKVYNSKNCKNVLEEATKGQLYIIFQVLHCILHGKIPMNSATKKKVSKLSGVAKKLYDCHFSISQSKATYLDLLQPLAEIIPGSFFFLFNKPNKKEKNTYKG